MTQKEFEQKFAKESGISEVETSSFLEELACEMGNLFKEENSLMISGFGTFEVKKKKERITTHPSTGDKILIPPKLTLSFQASKNLKERIKTSVTP